LDQLEEHVRAEASPATPVDAESAAASQAARAQEARQDIASAKAGHLESAARPREGMTIAERHPDWPPVEIRFHFGPHETAEDTAGIKSELTPDVDIYFVEEASGDRKTIELLQDVSDGKQLKLKPGLKRDPFFEGIARSVQGSGKVVESFDLLQGDPISLKDLQYGRAPWLKQRNFDTALNIVAADAKANSEKFQQREHIMAERLERRLEELVSRNPELLEKDKIVALSTLGSLHTTLYEDLEERGENVSKTFARTDFDHKNFGEQVMRAYRRGEEPSRDLLARHYIEQMLDLLTLEMRIRNKHHPMFDPLTNAVPGLKQGEPPDAADYMTFKRAVAERLSIEEIEQLHQQMARIGNYSTWNKRGRVLKKVLAQAGMEMPKSAAELHAQAEKIRRSEANSQA
jgi:hypothetical protein